MSGDERLLRIFTSLSPFQLRPVALFARKSDVSTARGSRSQAKSQSRIEVCGQVCAEPPIRVLCSNTCIEIAGQGAQPAPGRFRATALAEIDFNSGDVASGLEMAQRV
jgi:hypothetical protein